MKHFNLNVSKQSSNISYSYTEDAVLLRYDTMSTSTQLPTFRTIVLPLSADVSNDSIAFIYRITQSERRLLDHEDKWIKILRNVMNLCVYCATWHNISEDFNAQQRRSQSSKSRISLTVFMNEISILYSLGQLSELCHIFDVFHSCLWIMVLFRIVT